LYALFVNILGRTMINDYYKTSILLFFTICALLCILING